MSDLRQARKERNQRVAAITGIVLMLAAIVAGVVIWSGGSDTVSPATPRLASGVLDGTALRVGPLRAPVHVVVYEDFGSAQSRDFDLRSRDYLCIDAAHDLVRVDYRPIRLGNAQSAYSAHALTAWSRILSADPARTLAFQSALYDAPVTGSVDLVAVARRAGIVDRSLLARLDAGVDSGVLASATDQGRRAGVTRVPTLVVNGRRWTGTPGSLATRLETMIAQRQPLSVHSQRPQPGVG